MSANEAQLLDILRGLRFLSGVGDEVLKTIASVATLKEFPAGAVVFREGQSESHIYLVVTGGVALEVRLAGRDARRIQTVGAGELLGWSPVLGQITMTATARTVDPTRLIAVDGTQLVSLCEHNPKFGYEFMKRTALALATRLSATRLQLLDVYGRELPAAAAGQEG
jgi:CRP/FNR family transcriptional regulator, cyclic AMP receptor protein